MKFWPVVGVVPAPCLFLLWLIYLSLTAASPGPEGFQWQRLLLESGFLAIWFAPLQLGPRTPSGEASPSRLALWLLRFLLFRLLFESGLGQLLLTSGAWPQNFLDAVSLGMKLILPWAILLPRHPRQCAAAVLVAGQLLSLPASEHPLINLLTMLLCVTLLDDALIQSLLQKVFRRDFGLASPSPTGPRWPLLATLSVALLVGCA